MDEYKKSYLLLFNAVTEVIAQLKLGNKNTNALLALLISAQQRAEEEFISYGETDNEP